LGSKFGAEVRRTFNIFRCDKICDIGMILGPDIQG
jgi:hypothetical protein